MNFSKDMLLIDAFNKCDEAQQEKMGQILSEYGMHCLGCALAHGETFEQAASVHGANIDEMMEKINSSL